MASAKVDAYLGNLEEPKRSTLEQLRRDILDTVPGAEQGISYGLPAFRVEGKVIAGFAAFKHHLSYLPHSGSVFPELAEELARSTETPSSLPPELLRSRSPSWRSPFGAATLIASDR